MIPVKKICVFIICSLLTSYNVFAEDVCPLHLSQASLEKDVSLTLQQIDTFCSRQLSYQKRFEFGPTGGKTIITGPEAYVVIPDYGVIPVYESLQPTDHLYISQQQMQTINSQPEDNLFFIDSESQSTARLERLDDNLLVTGDDRVITVVADGLF